jgi:DnaJ-class molecular chaperone
MEVIMKLLTQKKLALHLKKGERFFFTKDKIETVTKDAVWSDEKQSVVVTVENDEELLLWLEDEVKVVIKTYSKDNGKICYKCDGTGKVASSIDGGVCWLCGGSGKI